MVSGVSKPPPGATEKKYKCTHLNCDKAYTRPNGLLVHMRSHTGERPFSCTICDKTFTEKGKLTNHLRTHSGERPFKCTICDNAFAEAGALAKHLRVHSGEKRYTCKICGEAFSQSGALKKHMDSLHSKKRPFKCTICNKTFARFDNLVVHGRVHTKKKPYKCKVDGCIHSFATTGNRKQHWIINHAPNDDPQKIAYYQKAEDNVIAYHEEFGFGPKHK
jgi:KRAB domain-containing zinc finger protein